MRRERLQDPDPAEQLEVDRVLPVEAEHEDQRAELDDQRRDLGDLGLLLRGTTSALEVGPVDVAGEQVRRRDRHDRRRHQRADRDRRERDPREPAREAVLEELRHDELRVGLAVQPDRLRPGGDRGEPDQRQQAEHQRVRRQDARRCGESRCGSCDESTAVIECGYMNSASAEPERQRRVRPVLRRRRDEHPGRLAGRRVDRRHLLLRRVERGAEADLRPRCRRPRR